MKVKRRRKKLFFVKILENCTSTHSSHAIPLHFRYAFVYLISFYFSEHNFFVSVSFSSACSFLFDKNISCGYNGSKDVPAIASFNYLKNEFFGWYDSRTLDLFKIKLMNQRIIFNLIKSNSFLVYSCSRSFFSKSIPPTPDISELQINQSLTISNE